MAKIATTLHPYHSTTWLSKEQAIAMLKEWEFTPNISMTWCKANSIEVSSTGHIRGLALQQYIDRRCFRVQQEAQDMGQPITVIMEDSLIHTDETPYCDDPECPCQEDKARQMDEARYETDFRYLEGTDAAWHC